MLLYVITLVMALLAAFFILSPILGHSRTGDSGFARVGMLVAVVAVLLAVGLYAAIGRPDASSQTHDATRNVNNPGMVSGAAGNKVGSVTSMLTGLEERLEKNPLDGDGWLLLAKSYEHLGQREQARESYTKAAALGSVDASLASKLDAVANDAGGVEIHGRVSVADDTARQIQPTDTIFVVAKAAGGSPMPLAVLRKPASALPFDFVLNDSLSMIKDQPLSAAERVIVSVKVSRSGDALQTNDALEAISESVSTLNPPRLELQIQ